MNDLINLSSLEVKVLITILNEYGKLTIRKDREYYRLQLLVTCNEVDNYDLNNFLQCVFNWDRRNNRYFIYGSKVIELLELLNRENQLYNYKLFDKNSTLLYNKELFTRSKGKQYTVNELTKLETIYNTFNT